MRTAIVRNVLLFILCCAAGVLVAGCGKKGDPTLRSFQKPAPVERLSALHRQEGIILTWTYPRSSRATARGFYIERSEQGGPFENVAYVAAGEASFTDAKVAEGREYRYRLRVMSQREVFSDASSELKVMTEPLPEPPAGLSFTVMPDSVSIKWQSAGEGVVYNLYRTTDPRSVPAVPLNPAPLETAQFSDALRADASVFYFVRSLRKGLTIHEGKPSQPLEIAPTAFVPAVPGELRAVRTQEQVFLSWRQNPEAWVKAYRIYRGLPGGSFLPIGESTAPVFLDQEAPRTPVSYFVTALGPAAESGRSELAAVPGAGK